MEIQVSLQIFPSSVSILKNQTNNLTQSAPSDGIIILPRTFYIVLELSRKGIVSQVLEKV